MRLFVMAILISFCVISNGFTKVEVKEPDDVHRTFGGPAVFATPTPVKGSNGCYNTDPKQCKIAGYSYNSTLKLCVTSAEKPCGKHGAYDDTYQFVNASTGYCIPSQSYTWPATCYLKVNGKEAVYNNPQPACTRNDQVWHCTSGWAYYQGAASDPGIPTGNTCKFKSDRKSKITVGQNEFLNSTGKVKTAKPTCNSGLTPAGKCCGLN